MEELLGRLLRKARQEDHIASTKARGWQSRLQGLELLEGKVVTLSPTYLPLPDPIKGTTRDPCWAGTYLIKQFDERFYFPRQIQISRILPVRLHIRRYEKMIVAEIVEEFEGGLVKVLHDPERTRYF